MNPSFSFLIVAVLILAPALVLAAPSTDSKDSKTVGETPIPNKNETETQETATEKQEETTRSTKKIQEKNKLKTICIEVKEKDGSFLQCSSPDDTEVKAPVPDQNSNDEFTQQQHTKFSGYSSTHSYQVSQLNLNKLQSIFFF